MEAIPWCKQEPELKTIVVVKRMEVKSMLRKKGIMVEKRTYSGKFKVLEEENSKEDGSDDE